MDEFKPRRKMVKELEALKKNKVLNDDLRQKAIVIDRYEAELKRFRFEAFLDQMHQGVRSYPQERVEVLKARGSVDNSRLLEALESILMSQLS